MKPERRLGRILLTSAAFTIIAFMVIAVQPVVAQTQETQKTNSEVQQLKEKLQKLEQTVQELKTQLSALEQAQKPGQPVQISARIPAEQTTVNSTNTPAVNSDIATAGNVSKPQDKGTESTFQVYGYGMLDAG